MQLQVNASVLLEPVAQSHAAPLFALIENSRDFLGAWLPWVPYMNAASRFEDFISGAVNRSASGTEMAMTIFYKGAVAGRAGIYYIDAQHKSGALGYWIGKDFAGKGIITESCRALTQYAFTEMGLNRIELKCATGNAKSAAVAERLGFTCEGTLREAEWLNGAPINLFLFSMLKKEWKG
jgi:ribosomal-protein-serine acetyltransferase